MREIFFMLLKNKIIAGAALDVIDGEWLSRKSY